MTFEHLVLRGMLMVIRMLATLVFHESPGLGIQQFEKMHEYEKEVADYFSD